MSTARDRTWCGGHKPEPQKREPAPDAPSNGARRKKAEAKPFRVVMVAPLWMHRFEKSGTWCLYRCKTREQAEEMLEKARREHTRNKPDDFWIEELN